MLLRLLNAKFWIKYNRTIFNHHLLHNPFILPTFVQLSLYKNKLIIMQTCIEKSLLFTIN